jgi:polyhydroxyalkanoate synthesis regulator phasin
MMWEMWKKGFNVWEDTTAKYLDQVLRNPAVLGPAGTMLKSTMKARTAQQKALNEMWAGLGLSTRADQERTLHALNQLQSRLMDLEEKLEAQNRD